MDFRYNNHSRELDEALSKDLAEVREVQVEKAATAATHRTVEPPSISRATRTAGDEIAELIDSSRKHAEADIAEHAVRRKLAGLKTQGQIVVSEFLAATKES